MPVQPPEEPEPSTAPGRTEQTVPPCSGIRRIRPSFIRFCLHTGLFRENEPAVDITATGDNPLRGIHPHKSGMNGKHRRRQIDDNTIPDQCFHLLILLPFHKTRTRQTGDRTASAGTDRHLHGLTGRHGHISRDTASRSADRRCIRPGSPATRPTGIGIDPHPAGKCSGRYTAAAGRLARIAGRSHHTSPRRRTGPSGRPRHLVVISAPSAGSGRIGTETGHSAGSPRAVIPASTPSAADTHDKKLGNPFRHHKRSGLEKSAIPCRIDMTFPST